MLYGAHTSTYTLCYVKANVRKSEVFLVGLQLIGERDTIRSVQIRAGVVYVYIYIYIYIYVYIYVWRI